MAAQNKLLTYI